MMATHLLRGLLRGQGWQTLSGTRMFSVQSDTRLGRRSCALDDMVSVVNPARSDELSLLGASEQSVLACSKIMLQVAVHVHTGQDAEPTCLYCD